MNAHMLTTGQLHFSVKRFILTLCICVDVEFAPWAGPIREERKSYPKPGPQDGGGVPPSGAPPMPGMGTICLLQ